MQVWRERPSIPSTDGPKLKLARAREHLEVLQEGMKAFIPSNADALKKWERTQTGDALAHIEFAYPPIALSLVAADFFQNLRASLDYLAWELASINSEDPFSLTEFPIQKIQNANQFNRVTQNLSEDMKAEIESLQPYHRKDSPDTHPLWVLNYFCNIAKHRSITLVGTALTVENPPIGTQIIQLDDGAIEMMFPSPEEDFKPDVSYQMALGSRREGTGISLLPFEVINIYKFVTTVAFPKFDRFFPNL